MMSSHEIAEKISKIKALELEKQKVMDKEIEKLIDSEFPELNGIGESDLRKLENYLVIAQRREKRDHFEEQIKNRIEVLPKWFRDKYKITDQIFRGNYKPEILKHTLELMDFEIFYDMVKHLPNIKIPFDIPDKVNHNTVNTYYNQLKYIYTAYQLRKISHE